MKLLVATILLLKLAISQNPSPQGKIHSEPNPETKSH